MPFPNFVHLTNASPGATRNSGTNGDLCNLLDWALPQVGWAIEYTATNARIYRPATGNRFRLHVYHDSAISGAAQRAVVRGCEDASNATTLIDPFPTVAQVANTSANWLISTTANTTDRAFHIVAWDTGFIYMTNAGGVANLWQLQFFGDVSENDLPDSYGTICMVRNNSGNTVINPSISNSMTFSSTNEYFARDITGTAKSSLGIVAWYSTTWGNISTLPPVDAAPGGKIRRDRIVFACSGSSTLTPTNNALPRRGFFPHLWVGLGSGNGSVTSNDDFTDTAYDPASLFILFGLSNANTQNCIVEVTNTWQAP